MSHDRIFIDEPTLRRNVQAYLRSPGGQPILEMFDFTLGMCLVLAAIACCIGLCMLPTIIWTIAGLKSLWYVLKLEPFEPWWNNPKHKPELLVPLICHGVIVGPDQTHALALGTFRPPAEYSIDWLARKADFLASVYTRRDAGSGPEHAALWKLLHDDIYHPHRRRRVPEPYAEGLDLLLFDVEVEANQARATPYNTAMFAFVADYGDQENRGEKGEIAMIPWYVVNDAVRVIER